MADVKGGKIVYDIIIKEGADNKKIVSDTEKQMKNLGTSAKETDKSLNDFSQRIQKITNDFTAGKISLSDYNKEISNLANEKQSLVKFDNLSDKQKKLVNDFKQGKISIDDFNKKLGEIGKNSSVFDKLATSANLIKGAFIGATAGVLAGLAKSVGDLAKEGALLQQTETSFVQLNNRIGESSNEMLKALQKASNGTVSNKDLMISANRAIVFEVAKNTEEMTTLFNTASVLGRDMGISTQQAFSDLVTGLGRSSPMILDNLGLVIKLEDEYKKYAQSIGKTVEQLTSQEKKQAVINAALDAGRKKLEEIGGNQENYVDKFERMQVAQENFRANLGKSLLVPLQGIISSFINVGDTVNNSNQQFDSFSRTLYGVVQVLTGVIKFGITPFVTAWRLAVFQLSTYINVFTGFSKDVKNTFKNLSSTIISFGEGVQAIFSGDITGGISKIRKSISDVKLETSETRKAIGYVKQDYNGLLESTGKSIDSIGKSFKNAFSPTAYDEIKNTLEAGNIARAKAKKLQEELSNSTDGTTKSQKDGEKQSEKYKEKLLAIRDASKDVAKELSDELTKSFEKFNTELGSAFSETGNKLAQIVLEAETKKKELLAKIGTENNADQKAKLQQELEDTQKILNARIGYEQRVQEQIALIRSKLTEAGIDPTKVNLDNLTQSLDLEKQIQRERELASLDEFSRFEKLQAEKILSLTESFILETNITNQKVTKQKEFETDLTNFLKNDNIERQKSVEDFANKSIIKYGEMASSLRDLISAQNQLNSIKQNSLPQFHNGGFVTAKGGEVHAGEYVIPQNLVGQMPDLISALESQRNGQTNNITINGQSQGVDMRTLTEEMLWRLSRM